MTICSGFRLEVSKFESSHGEDLFEPEALKLVAEKSQGVPRNINTICFHTLLEAHAEGRHMVSRDIVEKIPRWTVVVASRPTPAAASVAPTRIIGDSLWEAIAIAPDKIRSDCFAGTRFEPVEYFQSGIASTG